MANIIEITDITAPELDVFARLKEKRKNAQLWLIGEGEDLFFLQKKAEET